MFFDTFRLSTKTERYYFPPVSLSNICISLIRTVLHFAIVIKEKIIPGIFGAHIMKIKKIYK